MGLEVVELRRGLGFAAERADSSGARVAQLETLLREGQKLSECRILFLLPCPSRGLSFVGGVAVAAAAVVAVMK